MSDQSFDVRARVPAELWPTDEQLPGTTREKLIEILKEYETYMQLKRELLTVDPNPFIAVGKAVQCYHSSARPQAPYTAVTPVDQVKLPGKVFTTVHGAYRGSYRTHLMQQSNHLSKEVVRMSSSEQSKQPDITSTSPATAPTPLNSGSAT